jgi:cytochrome P450
MACVGEPVESVDFGAAMATPEFLYDPYPLYGRMRREQPVYRDRLGNWYLTRYADVEAALVDRRLSNDRERTTRALAAQEGESERLSRLTGRLGRVMTNTDPPEHKRLRQAANRAFTAWRVQDLRRRIAEIVDALLDAAVAAGPTADLVSALAAPLSVTLTLELFGIPDDERDAVTTWLGQMGGPATAEGLDDVELAVKQFEGYLAELVGRRRIEPGDDIVSALVTAPDGGEALTDDELQATCLVLLTAGDQTTANLIGNATFALLRHPHQLSRLQADPRLIRSAIEELLRFDTPSQVVSRVVAEPVEIGGKGLCQGDMVYLVLAAANRDPERFVDPDRLDLARSGNRHLSFGNGPHHCLGASLTRLQAEIAIGALVRRLPALRLDTDVVEWRPNPMQRGPARLPVAY